MIKIFCDDCKNEIERAIRPHELAKYKLHFCDFHCRNAYLKRTGHFKKMSLAGRPGRQRVMPISNKEKPRRRKQGAIFL